MLQLIIDERDNQYGKNSFKNVLASDIKTSETWEKWKLDSDESKKSPFYKEREDVAWKALRRKMWEYEEEIKGSIYKEDAMLSELIGKLSDTIFNQSAQTPMEYINECIAHIDKYYDLYYRPTYELGMVYDARTNMMIQNKDYVEQDFYDEIQDIFLQLQSLLIKITWTSMESYARKKKKNSVYAGFWDSIKKYFPQNEYTEEEVELTDEEYQHFFGDINPTKIDDSGKNQEDINKAYEKAILDFESRTGRTPTTEEADTIYKLLLVSEPSLTPNPNQINEQTQSEVNDFDIEKIEEEVEQVLKEEFSYLQPSDDGYFNEWKKNLSYYKESVFYQNEKNKNETTWKLIRSDLKQLEKIINKSEFKKDGNEHVENLVHNIAYAIFNDVGKSPFDILSEFIQHLIDGKNEYEAKYRYPYEMQDDFYMNPYDSLLEFCQAFLLTLEGIFWQVEDTTEETITETNSEEQSNSGDLELKDDKVKDEEVEPKKEKKLDNGYSEQQQNFINNYKESEKYKIEQDSLWSSIFINLRLIYTQLQYEDMRELVDNLFVEMVDYDENSIYTPHRAAKDIKENIENLNVDNLTKYPLLTAMTDVNTSIDLIFGSSPEKKEEEIKDERVNQEEEKQEEVVEEEKQEEVVEEKQEEVVEEKQEEVVEEEKQEEVVEEEKQEEVVEEDKQEEVVEEDSDLKDAQESFNQGYVSSYYYNESYDDLWKSIYSNLESITSKTNDEEVNEKTIDILYGIIESSEKKAEKSMSESIESCNSLIQYLDTEDVNINDKNLIVTIINEARAVKGYIESIIQGKNKPEEVKEEEQKPVEESVEGPVEEPVEDVSDEQSDVETNETEVKDKPQATTNISDAISTFKSLYNSPDNPNYERYQNEFWVSLYENAEKFSQIANSDEINKILSTMLSSITKEEFDESYQEEIEQSLLSEMNTIGIDAIESEEYSKICESLDQFIKSVDNTEHYIDVVTKNKELGTSKNRKSIAEQLNKIGGLCTKTSEIDFFEKLCSSLSDFSGDIHDEYFSIISDFQNQANSLSDTSTEVKNKISESILEIGNIFSSIKKQKGNAKNQIGKKEFVKILEKKYNLTNEEVKTLSEKIEEGVSDNKTYYQIMVEFLNERSGVVQNQETNNTQQEQTVDNRDNVSEVSQLEQLFTNNTPVEEKTTEPSEQKFEGEVVETKPTEQAQQPTQEVVVDQRGEQSTQTQTNPSEDEVVVDNRGQDVVEAPTQPESAEQTQQESVEPTKEQIIKQKTDEIKQRANDFSTTINSYKKEFSGVLKYVNDALQKLGVFFAQTSMDNAYQNISEVYDVLKNHNPEEINKNEDVKNDILSKISSLESELSKIKKEKNRTNAQTFINEIKTRVQSIFSVKKSTRKNKDNNENDEQEKKSDFFEQQLERIKQNDSSFDFNSLEQKIKNPNFISEPVETEQTNNTVDLSNETNPEPSNEEKNQQEVQQVEITDTHKKNIRPIQERISGFREFYNQSKAIKNEMKYKYKEVADNLESLIVSMNSTDLFNSVSKLIVVLSSNTPKSNEVEESVSAINEIVSSYVFKKKGENQSVAQSSIQNVVQTSSVIVESIKKAEEESRQRAESGQQILNNDSLNTESKTIEQAKGKLKEVINKGESPIYQSSLVVETNTNGQETKKQTKSTYWNLFNINIDDLIKKIQFNEQSKSIEKYIIRIIESMYTSSSNEDALNTLQSLKDFVEKAIKSQKTKTEINQSIRMLETSIQNLNTESEPYTFEYVDGKNKITKTVLIDKNDPDAKRKAEEKAQQEVDQKRKNQQNPSNETILDKDLQYELDQIKSKRDTNKLERYNDVVDERSENSIKLLDLR